MIDQLFSEMYENFKLNFYKNMFLGLEGRKSDLTAIETFCVEIINSLDRPTITDMTEFMGVSQPNMTYRVSSLESKGYVARVRSQEDKREYHLEVTDKFREYNEKKYKYIDRVLETIKNRFTDEEIVELEQTLEVIVYEVMEELKNEELNNEGKND